MKTALIGYGKMGHAVESVLLQRGHTIVARIDSPDWCAAGTAALCDADVAIEFTQPSAAQRNLSACISAGIPVVCGTTGWYGNGIYDQLASLCRQHNGRMLTAANFSIGMNIMFALNERLASLMRSRTEYTPSIREVHHIHKLDAPSGTAIALRNQIEACLPDCKVDIESIREGEVPGIHTVTYHSPADTISICHEAHGRQGLAEGAVFAAEWLFTAQPGVYTMSDVLHI